MWEGAGEISYLLAVNAVAQRSEIVIGFTPSSISLSNKNLSGTSKYNQVQTFNGISHTTTHAASSNSHGCGYSLQVRSVSFGDLGGIK
jgi:hypothetical protein